MSNKILVLIVASVSAIVILVAVGFFIMWSKLNVISSQSVQGGALSVDVENTGNKMGPIHPLDTFIVNLADSGGNRYLRVTMNLELKNDEVTDEVVTRLPQIRDGILMILPSKKYADISTVEGKTALRDEIILHLNSLLKLGSITNIYFTEFVVQ